MDGIYINGKRPKSKKEIKDAVANTPDKVRIEYTGMFSGYDGPVSSMADGTEVTFVGPDPYRERKFYGSIVRKGNTFQVK